MQTRSQLIGAGRTVEEICAFIEADSLHYLTVDQLKETCGACKLNFCTGCFDGNYPYALENYREDKFKLE